MNYLETGLSHTEFFPRKSEFRPPRFMPLCSLGRKYLGLEPLKKDELESIISRLTRPKRKPEPEENEREREKESCEPEVTAKPTRRFVGRKRMSSFEIEKMVDRLYGRRQTKDFEFVDNTFETADFINMTNRDSDDESDDAFDTTIKSDGVNLIQSNLLAVSKAENPKQRAEKCRKPALPRERGLAAKQDLLNQPIPKHMQVSVESGESVFKQNTWTPSKVVDKTRRREILVDRRDVGKRDIIVDRLPIDSTPRAAFTNVKRDVSSPKQAIPVQNNINDSYKILNRRHNENVISNHNISHALNPENPRRVPRLIKTAEPWSRRTEVVSRQVNQIRRPHSNLQPETSSRPYRVLNLRPVRPGRPDYGLARSDNDLPSIQEKDALDGVQSNNSNRPTDDNFIEQVACSNSPRTR